MSTHLLFLIVAVALFAWLCASLALIGEAQAGGGGVGGSPKTTYVYDELGRLVQVVDGTTGNSATYHYDAVGNLLSITTNSPVGGGGGGSTAVTISDIYPDEGPIGTQVTISGSDFIALPSYDTVKFNGTSATVNSATSNSIVATVPIGATSGPVTVTTPNGSASSGEAFTVTAGLDGPPTITGFSPTIGVTSTSVTITGTGFQANPTDNQVTFNTLSAAVTSASSTSITATVPQTATSGPITITTPFGQAVSAADFLIPLPGYSNTNTIFGMITADGTTVNENITTGQSVMLLFSGSVGQKVSLNLSFNNFGGGCYPTAGIQDPLAMY